MSVIKKININGTAYDINALNMTDDDVTIPGTKTFEESPLVPTVSGTSDSTTKAATTAFVQAVAALKLSISALGTNWETALAEALTNAHVPSSTAALAIATSWNTALETALGTNWSTILATAMGTTWTAALTDALGQDWSPALHKDLAGNWEDAFNALLNATVATALGNDMDTTATKNSENFITSDAVYNVQASLKLNAGMPTEHAYAALQSDPLSDFYALVYNDFDLSSTSNWISAHGYVTISSVDYIPIAIYAASTSSVALHLIAVTTGVESTLTINSSTSTTAIGVIGW